MSTDPSPQIPREEVPTSRDEIPASPRGNFFAVFIIFLIVIILVGGLIGLGVFLIREGMQRTKARQSASQSFNTNPMKRTDPQVRREDWQRHVIAARPAHVGIQKNRPQTAREILSVHYDNQLACSDSRNGRDRFICFRVPSGLL